MSDLTYKDIYKLDVEKLEEVLGYDEFVKYLKLLYTLRRREVLHLDKNDQPLPPETFDEVIDEYLKKRYGKDVVIERV